MSKIQNNNLSFVKFIFISLSLLGVFTFLYSISISLISPSSSLIHHNSVWAIFYFSHNIYLLFIFSITLYLLPNLTLFTGANNFSTNLSFTSQDGLDLLRLFTAPLFLLLLLHTTWSGPAITAWFSHIIFSNYQYKVTYLLALFFFTYLCGFLTSSHYSSTNVYDYTITIFNFFMWLLLTFFSNNIFTFIFFLELLSASITLLLVTSTFSSSYFYNSLSYSRHNYFQTSTPTALLQTLIFFFWITLVASLMLFLFLMVFYFKFLTFDWNLVDSIFTYLMMTSSLKSVFTTSFTWLLLLICIFIKCGIVPFYLWKPMFFKGMSITSLFFYVYIYYFSIFFYFTYIIFFYLNELFFTNVYLVIGFLIIATLGLASILFESFYLKSFLALSSILNSVLIFYALCSYQSSDFLLLL